MRANKKITGEFTQEFPESFKSMSEYLFARGYVFKSDGLKFTITNMDDASYAEVEKKSQEFDDLSNPQMDLFKQSEVTETPELIEAPETLDGDFEEVKPTLWIVKARREIDEDAIFTMTQFQEPTGNEVAEEFERLGYEDDPKTVLFYVKEADENDDFHGVFEGQDNNEEDD